MGRAIAEQGHSACSHKRHVQGPFGLMTDAGLITAYRPCVGVMLLNAQGLVWIGRRLQKQNDDGVGHWWQMPQGGIDTGEDPAVAAMRELEEETAVHSAKI